MKHEIYKYYLVFTTHFQSKVIKTEYDMFIQLVKWNMIMLKCQSELKYFRGMEIYLKCQSQETVNDVF